MTALLIIGGILLLLFLLLLLYAKLYVKWEDEKASLHIGVLWWKKRLYPAQLEKLEEETADNAVKDIETEQKEVNPSAQIKQKAKTIVQKPKNMDKEESPVTKLKSAVGAESMGAKKDMKETIFLVIDIIRSVVKPTKFMLRNMKISQVKLNVIVGGEEPDETAIRFGHWNAAVYGGLATMRNFMKIQCDKINIAVDFTKQETEVYAAGMIKIRFLVILIAAFRILINILVNTFKRAKENRKQSEATVTQTGTA